MSEAGRAWVLRSRLLFSLTAVIWTAIGIGVLTGMISMGPAPSWAAPVIGGLSLVFASVVGLLGWASLRGRAIVDYLAVAVAVVNIVATFLDQLGPADVVYVALAVALLVSLVQGMRAVRGAFV